MKRALVLAALLGACVPPTRLREPPPISAVEFVPPADYVSWWRSIEHCSGKRAPFRAVRWYVARVGHEGFRLAGDTTGFAGYAFDRQNAIALGLPWVLDPMIVRHEMAHRIASPHGHDPEIFQRRCRALVTCTGPCAARK